MTGREEKKRIAAMAAVLEHLAADRESDSSDGGAGSGLVGWKMAGRYERLGIDVSTNLFTRKKRD